jgi:hypothetical protein
LAGMFLVQAGKQAERLVEEAIHNRQNLPMMLVIAGDIGAASLEPELRRFAKRSGSTGCQSSRGWAEYWRHKCRSPSRAGEPRYSRRLRIVLAKSGNLLKIAQQRSHSLLSMAG